MEPEQTELAEKFRPLIEAETRELKQQSAATDMERRPVELDQQSVGRLSRMDSMQLQAMAQAIERRRASRLVALELALRRISQSDYGYCVDCGEFIGWRRLEIDPAALKCVKCA